MADVQPFMAVRPTRDKVSLVASRSYQSYTEQQRKARLDFNPFSFLHIVNPGYKYHKKIAGHERFALVKNRYLEFKEDEIFVKDKNPAYYIYKIVNRDKQTFCGIIAATSVLDYDTNIIKKHEQTIQYRETNFKEHLNTVGFNAEPVLLTYPDNSAIKQVMEKYQTTRAEFEFTTTYRDTHYLWIVDTAPDIATIANAFKQINTIYIADGHHRSAASSLLSKERKTKGDFNPSFDYFMSYLIPESDLKIYEFNRLVKGLNGLSKEEFLIKLDAFYKIENRKKNGYAPTEKHHFSMYLDGDFYSLYLRKTAYTFNDSLTKLDAQIMVKTILEPILGITDLRNDKRIAYVDGKKGMVLLKNKVDSGEFTVGFGLVPSSIEELKNIADDGLKMPPKSTYIRPKLRSGITIYEF